MHGNEKTYHGGIERLRSPERIALVEPQRAVDTVLATFADARSVLEIGVGSGLTAELFRAAGLRVAALDIALPMLIEARRLETADLFCCGTMEQVPLVAQSFDLVFFGHVLHETNAMVQVLTEARRVARKGVGVLDWPYSSSTAGPPLEHRYPPQRIHKAAADCGYASVRDIALTGQVVYLLDLNHV